MDPKEIEGKTVFAVRANAINAWEITFTDCTRVMIMTDNQINTKFGSIPGLSMASESELNESN